MISIILLETQDSGNIGAVCRAMANFDFSELIVIDPQCSIKDIQSKKRAKNAQDILQKIKIKKKKILNDFDYLIGTTAKLGTDYNIPRSPLTPQQLAEKLVGTTAKIGILFGREDRGLSNEEISQCDFIVSIPSSKRYHTLNLSHAVSIICYELFTKTMQKKIFSEYPLAQKPEKDALLKKIDTILDSVEFTTKEKKETQRLIWKRILGKSFLTQREIYALHGFFEKLK